MKMVAENIIIGHENTGPYACAGAFTIFVGKLNQWERRARRVTRRDLFHAPEHAPPVEVELLEPQIIVAVIVIPALYITSPDHCTM